VPESGSEQQPRRNGTSDPPVSVSERMTRCQASYGFRAERRRMPRRLGRLQFGAQIAQITRGLAAGFLNRGRAEGDDPAQSDAGRLCAQLSSTRASRADSQRVYPGQRIERQLGPGQGFLEDHCGRERQIRLTFTSPGPYLQDTRVDLAV
jgi:hypothetical protein